MGKEINFIEELMLGELHILPTDSSPEFISSPNGTLNIKGRGLFQCKTEVIDQVIKWINEYLNNPAEKTYVIITFEYLNSFSTTILVSILRKLSQVIIQSEKLVVQWYYDDDDEDILERGEYISSTFNIPITFILANH